MLAGQMSPNHDMGFSGPDFTARSVWELKLLVPLYFKSK